MVQWDSVEQLEQYQLRQCDHLPKLGTDSKLLAQFATLHRREKVFDLGCGVGVLGVLLAQRKRDLTLDGIDIVPDSAELAVYNLAANGLTGTIRQGDLNDYRQWAPRPGGYDLVISNPPYFAPNTGKTAEGARKTARSGRRLAAPHGGTLCTLLSCRAAGGSVFRPRAQRDRTEAAPAGAALSHPSAQDRPGGRGADGTAGAEGAADPVCQRV